MTFQQELNSWLSPSGPKAAEPPQIGSPAPSTAKLRLTANKPTVITFLRHCGCPFAEKAFRQLRTTAQTHADIDFVAVSHSSQPATDTWLKSLPQFGSEPRNLRVVVDEEKDVYAAWGLGASSFAHVLKPSSMMAVITLSREEGISNRPTESGSRWQTSGSFAVAADGTVRWGKPSSQASDVLDFEGAVEALSV